MHNGINYFAIVRFVYFVCSVTQSCLRLSNHHRHHEHPHQHEIIVIIIMTQAPLHFFPLSLFHKCQAVWCVCSGVWGQLWVVNQMLFWRFCGFCVLCSFDMKVGLDICLYAYAYMLNMCKCVCLYEFECGCAHWITHKLLHREHWFWNCIRFQQGNIEYHNNLHTYSNNIKINEYYKLQGIILTHILIERLYGISELNLF